MKNASSRKVGGQDKPSISTNGPHSTMDCEGVTFEGVEGGRDVVVEFGRVPVGTVAEKWIEITNVSPVSSKIYLKAHAHVHSTI